MPRPPLVVLAAALGLIAAAPASAAPAPATVQVRIENPGPRGRLVIRVCTQAQMGHACPTQVAAPPRSGAVLVPFTVPPGRYAVSVYQDVDGNGRLTFGLLGGPVEPWGYSRDAKAVMGPARFEDAAVDVPATGLIVPIRLGLGQPARRR